MLKANDMTRTVFSLTDQPADTPQARLGQGDWRRRAWWAWGVLALLWFVGSTAYYGFAVVDEHPVSSRPAPLLSSSACSGVIGADGHHSCAGVASLSRDRRMLLQDRASDRAIEAGSVILGPPVLSLLGMLVLMHYARPPSFTERRSQAQAARGRS